MPSENRKRHATPPTSGIERCFPRFGSAAGARTVRTSRSGLPSLERLAAHDELGVPTTAQELDGGRLAAARDREIETRSAQTKVADLHPVEPRRTGSSRRARGAGATSFTLVRESPLAKRVT